MQLLTISGSLRAMSSNASVLDALPLLAPEGLVLRRYAGVASLPHFNPDLEIAEVPAVATTLRQEVGRADGLILSSPEYAHGIAGSFKNALDWLVGSLEFPGKPVAVINAAPRAHHAEAQLLEILRTMSARVEESWLLTLPVQGSRLDAAGIAAMPAFAEPLRDLLRRFADGIAG
jgi:NAD(P)H-dependent FMN reductase